jgi:hypothetical protein
LFIDDLFDFLTSPANPELLQMELQEPLASQAVVSRHLTKRFFEFDMSLRVVEFDRPYRLGLEFSGKAQEARRNPHRSELRYALESSTRGANASVTVGYEWRSIILLPVALVAWLGLRFSASRVAGRLTRALAIQDYTSDSSNR